MLESDNTAGWELATGSYAHPHTRACDEGCAHGAAHPHDVACAHGAAHPHDAACAHGAAHPHDAACTHGAVHTHDAACTHGAAYMHDTACTHSAAHTHARTLTDTAQNTHSHAHEHGAGCAHCDIRAHGAKRDERAEKIRAILLIMAGVLFAVGLLLYFLKHAQIYAQIAITLLVLAWLLAGFPVIRQALSNIIRGRIFDEYFLMTVATVGALALGEFAEAAAVMLFYRLGEYLESRALNRSRRSIAALMDIAPEVAYRLVDDNVVATEPDAVQVGEIIVVRAGERIPLDGEVVSGVSELDTRSLTGESLPLAVAPGQTILSGSLNLNGLLYMRVTHPYADSTVSKILALTETALERKSRSEQLITRFARVYTPIVVGLAVLVALLPPLFLGASWTVWLPRALNFLVVSCPCALVISIPLSFFGGIGIAARRGILVKGSNVLERLAALCGLAFDKTGTLTEGRFTVTEVRSFTDMSKADLLALAARLEQGSTHPLAQGIIEAAANGTPSTEIAPDALAAIATSDMTDGAAASSVSHTNCEVDVATWEEISGKGVTVQSKDKQVRYLLGNVGLLREFMEEKGSGTDGLVKKIDNATAKAQAGTTLTWVARIGEEGEFAAGTGRWLTLLGYIGSSDIVKPAAREAIHALRQLNLRQLEILSGDCAGMVERVGRELELDGWRAELLPADKVARLTEIRTELATNGGLNRLGRWQRQSGGTVGFVGDGINDAPVLAVADVGVAMGGVGSDAAIEAADTVLMTDDPLLLPQAIRISRATLQNARQNMVLALGIKTLVLILSVCGLVNMWAAVFADVGVTLLAIGNALRLLRR
ncbi:MAG: heavy metal translocating P-type ATPase [Clostridiaceae bacterium]|nr:heavy metal translocating P-type ATPase [Clostridiaceae bacterium]